MPHSLENKWRIREQITRPDPAVIEKIKNGRIPPLGAYLYPFGIMDGSIQPLKPEWFCVGPAVTVDVDEPDPGIVMLAIDLCQPGDVLVIAARGSRKNIVFGGGMGRSATMRGLAGVVVDGAIGNTISHLNRNLPVYTNGVSPAHLVRYLPGSINVPVSCGGIIVNPGDIVVGMQDGVLVIRPDLVPWLLEELEKEAISHAETVRLLNENVTLGERANLRQVYRNDYIVWE